MSRKTIAPEINRWITRRYGSRRGFALTLWHQAKNLLGMYRRYRQVHWESVGRLVFVCKGNICRSAYTEAVAKSLGVAAISCGLDTGYGLPANPDAIRTAAKNGIDLGHHKTTPLQAVAFRENDLLVVMEPWQGEYIRREFRGEHECTLLGLWGVSVRPHIHDPYGASGDYFENCFDYLDTSVHEIIGKLGKTKDS